MHCTNLVSCFLHCAEQACFSPLCWTGLLFSTVLCLEKLVAPKSKQVEPSGNRRNKMLEFKKDFIEMEASNVETAFLKIITKYRISISMLCVFTWCVDNWYLSLNLFRYGPCVSFIFYRALFGPLKFLLFRPPRAKFLHQELIFWPPEPNLWNTRNN